MRKLLSYAIIAISILGITAGALVCTSTPKMTTEITDASYESENTVADREEIEVNSEDAVEPSEEDKINSDDDQSAAQPAESIETENTAKAESKNNSADKSKENSVSNKRTENSVSEYVNKANELISNKEEVKAEEVKEFCDSVNKSANRDKICSELDLDKLNSLLEKFGCSLGNDQNTPTAPAESTKPEDKTESTSPSNSGSQSSKPAESQSSKPAENQNTSGVSEYEKKVVDLVNEIRVQNGLSTFTLNTELSAVARLKSQDMKDKGYFSHTSPTYGSPFDMMKKFGISYRTAGENIAMGYSSPEAVVNAWMNSEGHRANILNSSFTQIGVGYVASGNYWTQMFIG